MRTKDEQAKVVEWSRLTAKRLREDSELDREVCAAMVHVAVRNWLHWESGEKIIPDAVVELFCIKAGLPFVEYAREGTCDLIPEVERYASERQKERGYVTPDARAKRLHEIVEERTAENKDAQEEAREHKLGRPAPDWIFRELFELTKRMESLTIQDIMDAVGRKRSSTQATMIRYFGRSNFTIANGKVISQWESLSLRAAIELLAKAEGKTLP